MMKMSDIKPGRWYETTGGYGPCLSTSGSGARASVAINVVGPLPRGRINMKPRDVTREIEKPQRPPLESNPTG